MQDLQPDARSVLAKALNRAQQHMGVDNQVMASILGINRTTLTRHYQSQGLDPRQNAGRLAAVVLRIYRAVFTLMGGDATNIRHWFDTRNQAFAGRTPVDAMQSIDGLVSVAQYCDAMRGRA